MIKRTFIIERGVPDCHGDVILLSGIKLPEKGMIVITHEFNPTHKPLGIGRVYIEDGVLKCDAELADERYVTAYPSVGIRPIWAEDNDHGVSMKECQLLGVG